MKLLRNLAPLLLFLALFADQTEASEAADCITKSDPSYQP